MLGVFEKVNLNIPDRLEERTTSKLESSHLLGEYVVSRYSNSSTLYISNISAGTSYPIQFSTKKLLSGSYPEIRCITYSSPCVFALLGNDAYGLNVETNEVVNVPPPPHTADICSIRSLLVSATYLVGVSARQIIVWSRANETLDDEISAEESDLSLLGSLPLNTSSSSSNNLKISKGVAEKVNGKKTMKKENKDDKDNDDEYDEKDEMSPIKPKQNSNTNTTNIDNNNNVNDDNSASSEWDSSVEEAVARVINLCDEQEEYGCGTITIISEFSRFMGNNLVVIVNNNSTAECAFQVWDVSVGTLVAWAVSPVLDTMESFITFACVPGARKIIGSYHSQVCVWDITRFKDPATKELQPPSRIPSILSIVTSLYADDSLFITGDNYGSVRMFDIQTNAFIGTLCGINPSGSMPFDDDTSGGAYSYEDTSDSNSSDSDYGGISGRSPEGSGMVPLGSLAGMFKNKVTKILRVGRWVLVTFANGRAELHDIFTTDVHEAADFFQSSSVANATSISAAEICNGKVVFAYTTPGSSSAGVGSGGASSSLLSGSRGGRGPQPDIVVWTPKPVPDTFEYFAEFPAAVRCASPLRMIRCAMEHLIARCDSSKVELTAHATKLREAAAMVDALDRLRPRPPFCFVQDMAEALDFYEIYLGEVAMYRSKVAKSAPLLAEAARKFYISLDLMGSLMDYVGDVDMRYSSPDAVRTAPPLGVGQAAVFSFRRRVLQSESGSGLTLADTDPRVCMMLSGANAILGELQGIFETGIRVFDETCTVAFSDKGPEGKNVDKLISVYTKLNELNEDCKEAGKEVGELIGEKQKGKWYEGGGKYRDPDSAVSSDLSNSQH